MRGARSADVAAGRIGPPTRELRPFHDVRDERALAADLVRHSEADPLAPFVVNPKKSYVFAPDGKAVIGYAARLGVAVASGDPVGPVDSWAGAVGAFADLAQREGWTLAVIGAGERARPLWAAQGLRAVPIGRDVVVRTRDWRLEGRLFRDLRQAVQRTHNAGVTTRLLREQDAPRRLVEEVRFLQRLTGRDSERGFSMILGRFFDGAQPDALLALARDREGRLVAAQRYLSAGAHDLSLDVPLRARDAPNGVDARLVAEVVAWADERGVERISLSFAPFPDLFAAPRAGLAGMVAVTLHVLDPLIHLRRLYRYLRKFHAFDQERFVMLRLHSVLRVGLVLLLLEFG